MAHWKEENETTKLIDGLKLKFYIFIISLIFGVIILLALFLRISPSATVIGIMLVSLLVGFSAESFRGVLRNSNEVNKRYVIKLEEVEKH